MFKVSLRSLLSHKIRLILTTLAIMIGVSSVAGTFIFVDTINATFTNIFQSANAGVAVTVRGHVLRGEEGGIGGQARRPIPRSLLSTVATVAGVKDAVGVIFRNGATLIGPDGKAIGGNGPPTFGTNWISDSEISPYHLRSGRAPSQDDDVVVDARVAADHKLSVGQRVSIAFTNVPEGQFTITGIAGFGSGDVLGGATTVLFTEKTARRLMAAPDTYDAIDVSAPGGLSHITLRDRIAAVLPPEAEAATGQDAAAAAVQSTESTISTFIGTPLLVFAFIFLFVGSFLIVNTFNILVAQRTRELALLRAMGATRRQVLTSVLVEASLTGLLASILGVFLGVGIANVLLALINAPATAGLSVQPRSFVTGIVVGVGVTLIAATFPARRATRVPPVAALREALPETQSLSRTRMISGAALLLGGCAAVGVGLSGATGISLQLLGAGVFLIFLGVAALAPLVVAPVAVALGWPVRRTRGAAGVLAGENARRNPRRTALTSAALMIGLALVTSVAVLTASFRASTDAAIEGALRADLVVFGNQGSGFSPTVAATLVGDSRLRDITELRFSPILVGSASQSIFGLDPHSLGRTVVFDMVSGDAASIARPRTAVVDQAAASARHLRVGDTVTAGFPAGADVDLRIGGIYKQNALAQGYLVSLATLSPYETMARDFFLLANAAQGTSASDAERALKSDLRAFPLLRGMSRGEYRDFTAKQIDSLLNLVTGLLLLALIIAVFGIVNTLALSVLERTREIGLLRALGMTRRQTRSMVRWESVLIALIGAVLGLTVGVGLGLALTNALHDSGIDHVSVPGGNLIFYAIAAGIFGVIAAIFPAIRASRLDVLQAIATE